MEASLETDRCPLVGMEGLYGGGWGDGKGWGVKKAKALHRPPRRTLAISQDDWN